MNPTVSITADEIRELDADALDIVQERRFALMKAIHYGAKALQSRIKFADPVLLLGAIAMVETGFCRNNIPRFEVSYSHGERYFGPDQRRRFLRWGLLSSCSYSSFQIMYPTACELGFDIGPKWNRNPTELFDDETAVMFVVAYINKRMLDRGVQTIAQFADAYNSGSHKDGNVPTEYINRFQMAYARVGKLYGLADEDA